VQWDVMQELESAEVDDPFALLVVQRVQSVRCIRKRFCRASVVRQTGSAIKMRECAIHEVAGRAEFQGSLLGFPGGSRVVQNC
jgi:hypothetical protein